MSFWGALYDRLAYESGRSDFSSEIAIYTDVVSVLPVLHAPTSEHGPKIYMHDGPRVQIPRYVQPQSRKPLIAQHCSFVRPAKRSVLPAAGAARAASVLMNFHNT